MKNLIIIILVAMLIFVGFARHQDSRRIDKLEVFKEKVYSGLPLDCMPHLTLGDWE